MVDTKHDQVIQTGKDQMDGVLCSLKGEAQLANLDRQEGHQYLPMDIYIDPKTMKDHFLKPTKTRELYSCRSCSRSRISDMTVVFTPSGRRATNQRSLPVVPKVNISPVGRSVH